MRFRFFIFINYRNEKYYFIKIFELFLYKVMNILVLCKIQRKCKFVLFFNYCKISLNKVLGYDSFFLWEKVIVEIIVERMKVVFSEFLFFWKDFINL